MVLGVKMEEWRNIPDEELNFYQVSNTGKVRILPRVVDTHIVNRGRDMIVKANRKGKEIKPSYDGGRPCVRLKRNDGTRLKKSLPLLVLQMFGPPCPGDIDQYTAKYIDNDVTNNHIDNLVWISRATLASAVGKLTLGEEKEHFQKYHNLVIYCYDYVVAYFKNTTDAIRELNKMGFDTSETVLTRALKHQDGRFFNVFTIKLLSDEDFQKVQLNNEIQNVKRVYDIIMMDREVRRKVIQPKPKEIVSDLKERPKLLKDELKLTKPLSDINISEVKKEIPKPKVEKKHEVKEPKPKVNKSIISGNNIPKPKMTTRTNLDDLTEDDFLRDMEREKKEKFKEELLKRLGK